MSNRRNKNRAGGRKPPRGESPSHPPRLESQQITYTKVLRFQATSAVSANFEFRDILDTIVVAATATTGYDLFHSVKVRAVEVWALPSQTTPTTVQVQFNGSAAGYSGDSRLHTDTSMGLQPAHLIAKPLKGSLAGTYQPSVAANCFYLSCPSGSVVDLHVTFRNQFAVQVQAQNALSGATAGMTYFRGLDSLATASTILPSVITNSSI